MRRNERTKTKYRSHDIYINTKYKIVILPYVLIFGLIGLLVFSWRYGLIAVLQFAVLGAIISLPQNLIKWSRYCRKVQNNVEKYRQAIKEYSFVNNTKYSDEATFKTFARLLVLNNISHSWNGECALDISDWEMYKEIYKSNTDPESWFISQLVDREKRRIDRSYFSEDDNTG